MDAAKIVEGSKKHPSVGLKYSYGTAGFRLAATGLDPVMYRLGLLAALRSKSLAGAAIGVMVTASHNPEPDNGAKLVEPHGEMLVEAWEAHAARLANCKDEDVADVLQAIAQDEKVDWSVPARVIVGRDTRASGEALCKSLQDGCSAMAAACQDCGILTTPQLHYIVRCTNDPAYGEPTEAGYHAKLAAAFRTLTAAAPSKQPRSIVVDCANGVGAVQFRKTAALLQEALQVTLINDGTAGQLNDGCGADFVKVQQKAPAGVTLVDGQRYASFDGDADRLVYFFKRHGVFCLMDGDRIASLAAQFIRETADQAGLALNVGAVQTAYANGSSTEYLSQKMNVPVACTKTGVKHLHHKALEFDVGVYFEANGHGTVLFSPAALKIIHQAQPTAPEQQRAVTILRALADLINQTVGDAISDLLMVEAILALKNMDMEAWAASYDDLPNRQLKVKIADRNVVETTDAERRCTAPPGLQEAIDKLVAATPKGRSFVRPSGTEDVVRVYAEASTQEDTDALADAVAQAVFDLAGGVGDRPVSKRPKV